MTTQPARLTWDVYVTALEPTASDDPPRERSCRLDPRALTLSLDRGLDRGQRRA